MTEFFNHILESTFGSQCELLEYQNIRGGCINHAAKLITRQGTYFIKWNSGLVDMFEKELKGLQLLAHSKKVNIPKVFQAGEVDGKGYLLMEFIENGRESKLYWQSLGRSLAQLHQISNDQFGLNHDNYIGRLPQVNKRSPDWKSFFVDQRLLPQIEMAQKKALLDHITIKNFELLFNELGSLIPEEKPSLLHGDLWSGNIYCSKEEKPYLIDPAVYYGHREAELAFTTMFGGFDQLFYDSYNESFPLTRGFEQRIELFNLYPLLVHLNLFGSSYLGGIIQTLKKYT